MRNRVWIRAGDIVLLGLRDFGDDAKADIILKYYDEEAYELQELGELPEHVRIAENLEEDDDYGDEDDGGPMGAAMGGDDEEEQKIDKDIDVDAI